MEIQIVDCETDSPKPQQAQMLEIAIARLDLETGDARLVFDSLVRPEGHDGWRECWFLTHAGIPDSDIECAPPLSVVKEQIISTLQKAPVTAYNLSFDLQVLIRHGIVVNNRWPCLMLACTPILKLPGYYGDYKYPKFSEGWRFFFPDEPFEEKHRAGWDAMHEAKLAYELHRQGYFGKGR